jgi:glyoxylase-like metal-dependent hydrolase (beta-lactamase superfamily II)
MILQIPAWVTETNGYIVTAEGDERAIVVDAPPDPERIGSEIAGRGLTVAAILLTHGHVDHTGGAGELAATTGARVHVHRDDDFLTLHPAEQLRRMFGMVPPGSYEVPETLESLEDGEKLEIAGISLEVRHTPGHTPGHCCFYWDSEAILFSGDQLFAGSIGRTDLPGGSMPQLIQSMREEVMVLDDEVRVLPGHGPETTIGRERRANPFAEVWA